MKKDCNPFVSIIVETEGFQSFLYLFYLILPFLLLLLMQIVLDLSR